MVMPSRHQHLILPIAPLAAGAVGVLTAGVFALLPTGTLEALVVDSGVAALLSAAEPPLGFTARVTLTLLCGGGIGLIAWFALFLALGTRSVVLQRAAAPGEEAPVLRRADSHPDAPARRPLFANRDLGTPFLDVRAQARHIDADVLSEPEPDPIPEERPLPDDLDQPLASYDPAAIPEAPADPLPPPARTDPAPASARPVAPAPALALGERLETFALTPMVRAASAPLASDDTSATIHALLDRLERSVPRRKTELPHETLEETLSTLRTLATRGT